MMVEKFRDTFDKQIKTTPKISNCHKTLIIFITIIVSITNCFVILITVVSIIDAFLTVCEIFNNLMERYIV